LPAEIIEKLANILKMVLPQVMEALTPPVVGCSCPFCQIAGHLFQKADQEEEVKPEEISFRDWQVIPTGEKLYSVESPIDPLEKYTVFLGEPIGCTCGIDRCEHVLAVLKS
jgi:hypothetical protein